MAEDSIPAYIMDGNPEIFELTNHVEIGNWNRLGIQLQIEEKSLEKCHTCEEMYQKWISTKTKRERTRRILIAALKVMNENRLAEAYMEYLTTLVS